VFESILPSEVATVAVRDDIDGATLFPQEEALVARAVEKRRREFASGRACARGALAKLGLPATSILTGPQGEPHWPEGVVGSITHCDGCRASAVASADDLAALGIDAEPHLPLPDGVLADIALPHERERLGELAREAPEVHWDRLLFSIKESIYKAWFPLAGRWLGFEDAAVEIDPAERTFSARFLVAGPVLDGSELTGLRGRWLARDGLVLGAIALPARAGKA
jgi:4'-phosphopantetheinyl transferase EntD